MVSSNGVDGYEIEEAEVAEPGTTVVLSVKANTDDENFDPIEREEFSEFFSGSIYKNEINYFCHCLVNKQSPLLCPVSDSFKTISVSCAESRSMEKNEPESISISL